MRLKTINPDISTNVRTYLTTAIAATATSLTVKNTTGLAQYDWIVLGKLGEDKTECVQITAAPTDTGLTVSAVKFAHGVDTEITYTRWNQIRYYRSTDGGTTYTVLATVSIQWDRLMTTYEDLTSVSTYYYTAVFRNGYSGMITQTSNALIATGYQWYMLKPIQDRIIDLFPDPKGQILTRSQLTTWINEEYRRLTSLASKIDQGVFLKSNESSPSSLTASTAKYSLPSDFKSMKKMEIAFDGTNYYRAYPQHVGFGYPTLVYDQTSPLYVMVGTQVEIRPTPTSSSGKYKLWYYYIPDQLSSDNDSVDLAIRPYLDALVYHALARGKQKDKKYDEAKYWDNESLKVEDLMVNELQNRTVMDIPRWVEMTDSSWMDVEDYLWQ